MDFKVLFGCIIAMTSAISETATVSATEIKSSPHLIPCKEGWFSFGEKCYKILGQENRLPWKQASIACSLEQGHLATIDSKELQEYLTTFLLLSANANVWIGLNDRLDESSFLWDDGSDSEYRNWEPNEPSGNRYSQEDCVEIRLESVVGMWNDGPCDNRQHFLCQSEESNATSHPDPRFCSTEEGGGWKYLNSCYNIVTQEQSWEDAEKYCQNTYQGHLVMILDSRNELFLSYLSSTLSKEFWIGIKIREQAMQKWSSGWHVSFSNWNYEHKHFISGTCSLMSQEKVWTSAPCFQKHPFICETSKYKSPILNKLPEGWKCPNESKDWIDLDGDTCYLFETNESLKWHVANYYCMKKGGTLASIHSDWESNALRAYFINSSITKMMNIGLHRGLSNNHLFEWVDETELDYENWYYNQPNNFNGNKEECVQVFSTDMKWHDYPCNDAAGYICSAKKTPPFLKLMNESVMEGSLQEEDAGVPPNSNEKNEAAIADSLQKESSVCGRNVSLITILGILVGTLVFSVFIYIWIRYKKKLCSKDHKSLSFQELYQRDTY